MIHCFLQYKHP